MPRRRLVEAATAALAETGYARVTAARITELSRVSSRTFYEHFDSLWACMAAAYDAEAGHLCREVEAACTGGEGDRRMVARTGIAAALALVSTHVATGEPQRLRELEPALSEFLLAPL